MRALITKISSRTTPTWGLFRQLFSQKFIGKNEIYWKIFLWICFLLFGCIQLLPISHVVPPFWWSFHSFFVSLSPSRVQNRGILFLFLREKWRGLDLCVSWQWNFFPYFWGFQINLLNLFIWELLVMECVKNNFLKKMRRCRSLCWELVKAMAGTKRRVLDAESDEYRSMSDEECHSIFRSSSVRLCGHVTSGDGRPPHPPFSFFFFF